MARFLKTYETRIEINLNIFWAWTFEFSKRAKSLSLSSDQDQSKFSSRTVFSTTTGALIWLRQFLHWFDHQTKPSIRFLYYFCNLLYRSACIAETVIFLSLYWRLFCELPRLVILFCTGCNLLRGSARSVLQYTVEFV